jgi:CO/xanthine dehydrogenase Mo-binding subunit
MMRKSKNSIDIFGATLTRRQFLKTSGILAVGVSVVGPMPLRGDTPKAAVAKNSLDPSLAVSWLEIHPDNTVTIRTGKNDFGQGSVYTSYRQIVAEELSMPFEAISTVVTGTTDQTPDGGGSFGFLNDGTPNLRKVAAYTYQALLDLASKKLVVPKDKVTAREGVLSGGGKSVSYGDLIKGEQLNLTIPVRGDLTSIIGLTVDGNPPMKPVSEYTVIGKSFPSSAIKEKVSAKANWATDVRLPGMLHGRVVHPRTLGSTLVSVGKLDKTKYPNAQVVVKGNLVGVVAPTEWEAIQAAQQVATDSKWTDWKGLPGSGKLYESLRNDSDWKTTPVMKSNATKGDISSALSSAKKKLSATYQVSYMKHAPIGPTMAIGDVHSDGMVHIHTHNQNPQELRGEIAKMLGTTIDKVVVHVYPGPGHYGRSNGGNAGAEDEAVILSQAVGKPVRVQWMRADDIQWSTQSPASFSDVELAVDGQGKLLAFQIDHYMPAMQDDRLVGAVLAGLPTMSAPDVHGDFVTSTMNNISDEWLYTQAPNVIERGHGTFQVGQKASPIAVGLRDHSMRTPVQFQQNFPREAAINEAATLAGADAIQFRIDNLKEVRAIGALKAVRDASGWDTRPSPGPHAAATGKDAVRGRGVSLMLRDGTYWACVCHIAVTPETGTIKVEKCTLAVDPGVVINPAHLKRQVEGGAMMGISIALLEEVTTDESGVIQDDWNSYPILTMADIPEIKVELISNSKVGKFGGGSEAANALAAPAIAAAFHDATGKAIRRLPMKPTYALAALKT